MAIQNEAKSKSILFFFFPRRHRLPVGSLYGGVISVAKVLGLEPIFLRFGTLASASSLSTAVRNTASSSGDSEQEPAARAEERPIVAQRVDWRPLRWLAHVIASPLLLLAAIKSRRPSRVVVRDLPHALIAAPIVGIFGIPLVFVADSKSWSSLDDPDPLTGKLPKYGSSAVGRAWRAASIRLIALCCSTIMVPSLRIQAIFFGGGAPAAQVIVCRYPLLTTEEPAEAESARLALLRQHSFAEDSFLLAADVGDCDIRSIELFIRAVQILDLPQLAVLLLGEIDDRERVRGLIAGFGLRDTLHLTGWVDSPAAIYGTADLVVSLPSAAGVGATALGAIRLGVPVAAFDDPDGRAALAAKDQLYSTRHVEHFSSWLRELILKPERIEAARRNTILRGAELADTERKLMLKVLLDLA